MNLFGRLTNNLWLKLLSLALALVLTTYVIQFVDPMFSKQVFLPLELRQLEETLVLVEPTPLPAGVQVKVSGKYSQVRSLPGRNSAYLDCNGIVEPGTYVLPVQFPDLADVQIARQELTQIPLRFEALGVVTLPIEVDRRGEVDPNYDVGEEHLSQSHVEISGPRSLVDRVSVVQIEPNVEGTQDDIRGQMLPLQLYDANDFQLRNTLLTLRPGQVRYSLRLQPIASIRVLKVIPKYSGQPPAEYLLEELVPKPLAIPVSAELVDEDVFAVPTEEIDLSGARESFTVEAKLVYPFEVPADSRLPETCEVAVQLISIDEVGGSRVALELVGGSDEYDYIITPPEIVLRSEALMLLKPEEGRAIQAVLHVTGLGPGEHRLAPQLTLPLSVERVKIDPATVQVTIIQSGD